MEVTLNGRAQIFIPRVIFRSAEQALKDELPAITLTHPLKNDPKTQLPIIHASVPARS